MFSTRCRSSVVGCDFVSFVCSPGSVRLPSATGSVLFTRRIFASMHLACRDLRHPIVRKLSICTVVPNSEVCPSATESMPFTRRTLAPRRDMEALPCCSVTCRHSQILDFVSFLRDEFLLQSPACLLQTRRLADNHGMRFASQRLRYSLPQPLERGTPTAHRPPQRGHPSALSEENGRLDFGVSGVVLSRRTKTVFHRTPFHDLSEQPGKGKQKKQRAWHGYAQSRLH